MVSRQNPDDLLGLLLRAVGCRSRLKGPSTCGWISARAELAPLGLTEACATRFGCQKSASCCPAAKTVFAMQEHSLSKGSKQTLKVGPSIAWTSRGSGDSFGRLMIHYYGPWCLVVWKSAARKDRSRRPVSIQGSERRRLTATHG